MTPTEFATSLAEVMAVERTEIATVDRALAKHGLRQLARGRYRPDITLREGVQLVCAWAAARNLTLAAEEVQHLERCVPQVMTAVEHDFTGRKNPHFPAIFGKEEHELEGINFLEILSMLARQLAAGKFPANHVWVALEKGGAPRIEYRADFVPRILQFTCFPAAFAFKVNRDLEPEPEINVKITTSISGSVLKWIQEATDGV